MAYPDIATLLLVTITLNGLVAAFMWLMHRTKPRARYFRLLAVGAAGSAVGWTLYATRDLGWPSGLSYVAAYLLVALYPGLLILAVRRFLKLKPPGPWQAGLCVAFVVLALGLAWAAGQRPHSMAVATGANALLFSASWLILLRHGRPFSPPVLTMLVTIGLSAMVLWLRLASGLWAHASGGAPESALILMALLIPMLASIMLALAFSVAEFRRDERKLREAFERDGLTGLPNRVPALEHLRIALERNEPLSLAFIDLDGFKRINDSLGHATGDLLLAAVSERLRPMLREGELLARFGGDEFLLLLPLPPGPSEHRCRELLQALSQPFEIEQRHVFVGGSAGLCAFPEDAREPRELLRLADTALYQAKLHTRGDVSRYTARMGDAASAELATELELRAALEDQRVQIFLQPRLDLVDGVCRGAEALMRIRRADGSLILPGDFIAVAERCGLMPRLGAVVLEQSCQALSTLRRSSLGEDFRLSVNLSPLELHDEALASRVEAALCRHGLPASALELELTETALVDDPLAAERRLSELRALGVAIALDDFGAGFSGLSHLLRFPISVLKIDRSFIERLRSDRIADALVEGLVGMAQRLGLRVVAEGIERHALITALQAMDCDEAQGYAIAKPMPLESLVGWLDSAREPQLTA
ncbi:putative bifunctional diguanylate cyclase/phosphodiesterase [Pseudomarimonas salicorniae]|uniref:EAL domain-containing protein n=1 Tax=Pseudomarimonas salicorniae TaxID=2933270 RepID=A0ABT0GGE0_9GAMM|nr:EAL domain-containing protein [Lysobacter sp. CAU 1642]MCK7593621.1 EAL domain-containing protein [Lysobacter sp. CAU 1642]